MSHFRTEPQLSSKIIAMENKQIHMADQPHAPIGVFDSGLGGLTVLNELMRTLPNEAFLFVADSARCPYGPRPLAEVRSFALQICEYLMQFNCKMIVIACNTATAAGLAAAQQAFPVPIVGVVEPGARAAAHMTHNRRVGVIATQGTVAEGVYEQAIHHLDAGIQVFQQATPDFVRIAESGLAAPLPVTSLSPFQAVCEDPQNRAIARAYLEPLRAQGIDTLVLGCTHYPLIAPLIAYEMGNQVALVSSAEETAQEVRGILERRHELACAPPVQQVRIHITGEETERFANVACAALSADTVSVSHIDL